MVLIEDDVEMVEELLKVLECLTVSGVHRTGYLEKFLKQVRRGDSAPRVS